MGISVLLARYPARLVSACSLRLGYRMLQLRRGILPRRWLGRLFPSFGSVCTCGTLRCYSLGAEDTLRIQIKHGDVSFPFHHALHQDEMIGVAEIAVFGSRMIRRKSLLAIWRKAWACRSWRSCRQRLGILRYHASGCLNHTSSSIDRRRRNCFWLLRQIASKDLRHITP
jgi:hypothetical protein